MDHSNMNWTTTSRPQDILKTGVFFVDRKQILRSSSYPDDFIFYEPMPGKLGLSGEFWMGAVGLEGSISLLIPPSKRDIDATGYSIRRGKWDWWAFLSFVTIPRGNYKTAILISFSYDNFFDNSQDIACCLEPAQIEEAVPHINTHFSPDTSSVGEAYNAAWVIFQREFSAHVASPEYQRLMW